MSPGLTQLFVCVYWFGIFLEINVLRRVELWPWLWYHPCWFSTTKTRLIHVVVVVVGNVDDFICWNFTVNSQVNVMMMMMLSCYYLPILPYFFLYSELSHDNDNGDKCVSVNLMKLDALTRILVTISSKAAVTMINVSCLCLVCTVRIFYKPQISDYCSGMKPSSIVCRGSKRGRREGTEAT